jgi:hypothetical protein
MFTNWTLSNGGTTLYVYGDFPIAIWTFTKGEKIAQGESLKRGEDIRANQSGSPEENSHRFENLHVW